MPDQYGVPDNMFGHVPEEFYGMIGRVVMVAAVLEMRLWDLATNLDGHDRQKHAGKSAKQLEEVCRPLLAEQQDPVLREQGDHLLVRVREALNDRNDVVHRLWPSTRLDEAFGWRPVRSTLRDVPHGSTRAVRKAAPDMRRLIVRLAELVGDLGERANRLPAE